MQATILKPLPCPVVGFNRPLRSRLPDRFKSPPIVSFPSKTTSTCIKSKATSIPSVKIDTRKIINPLHMNPKTSPLPRGGPEPPKALRDDIASYLSSRPHPPGAEKPEWWWRSLATLPYLMNFFDQRSWIYAYQTKNPSTFLKSFDYFTSPLFLAICHLPHFFLSGYGIICFFGIIRQEKSPYFLRFHAMTAVMVGAILQAIGLVSGWCPSWFFPPHFWSAASVGFLMTEMYCVACAVRGMYPEIPVVSDAAYMYTDLRLR